MLDAATCASDIVTKLKTANSDISGQIEQDLIDQWTLICEALINHITSQGVVNTTVTGSTGTGPAGGPLPISAQPGTGTIS